MSDIQALFESMKTLADECNCSIKAEFEYADGALFAISYQKGVEV